MSNQAVIFDLDGTLLDTLDDLVNAVNHILRVHSFPERTRAELRSFLGNGARDLVKRSLPAKVDDEDFEKYLDEYVKYYNAHSKIETKPYPGVIDLLTELKSCGILTAVVSNKPDAAARSLCEEYFGPLVDFAIGDRPDIARKPSADPVKLAMKELGCDRAVYVGDSEVDVMTAANAGLSCVSLTWGFRDKDLLEKNGATCFADNVEQLKKHIRELLEDGE